jgi:hypothetical protein
MSKNTSQTTAVLTRITRTQAIAMLQGLQTAAGQSRTGRGKIFSAEWVAKGEPGSGPYPCRKVLRFQVQQHTNGAGMRYNPAEQGYMVVFEMVPGRRALKLYIAEAQHRLTELAPQLEAARQAAEGTLHELEAAKAAATEAAQSLAQATGAQYKTVTAKKEAEKPLKKERREADKRFKAAEKAGKRALRKLEALKANQATEQEKIDNPTAALTKTISAQIARLKTKLEGTKDAAGRRQLAAQIAADQALLQEPAKYLTIRYRLLNLRGLRKLKIQGQQYEITTPSDPALPETVASK